MSFRDIGLSDFNLIELVESSISRKGREKNSAVLELKNCLAITLLTAN